MIDMLKCKIKNLENHNYILYCFFQRLWKRPILMGSDFILCYLYSSYLSFRLFGFSFVPRVFFGSDIFKVVVSKSKTSKIFSNEKIAIVFQSYMHGNTPTAIGLDNESELIIEGKVYIGNGCSFRLQSNSKLTFSGSSGSNLSGFTCDLKLICSEEITIGSGSIISWGCFISDTSNHSINGNVINKPISIGNQVWISEGCTISSGTIIGDGSIVGSKSFVKGTFPKNSLIVGCPAKVKKQNIHWTR